MVDLSSITFLQGLLIVYSGFHPVSGNYGKCMCELGNHINCSQVRCPGNKCGDSTFSDNLTCVCKTVKTTKIGCQVLRINRCDLEFEVRSCSELHPFICSDFNYNFQIYQDEVKTWPEAVKTCESRNLQIARVNLRVLHSPSNVSFWTGTFYGLASDNDTDVSQFQIRTSNIRATSASTGVTCEIQHEIFRMTTCNERLTYPDTSSDVIHTSNTVNTHRVSCGDTEGTTWTTSSSLTSTSTVSSQDRGGHHGNTAVIAGATSAAIVFVIVVVLVVVYVRKIRTTKKNDNDIQLSDIDGIGGHTDHSSNGRSHSNGRSQYLPEERINYVGQNAQVAITERAENTHDHFKSTRRDVEIGRVAQVALKD